MTATDSNLPTPDELLQRILEIYRRRYDGGEELIERAYARAEELHRGQLRKSGEPYVVHPLIVTQILAGYGMDSETLAAALLHDTIEDTDVTMEEIAADFGDEVAHLIDGVTKLDRLKYSSREEAQAATIRKMAIAISRDIRVLLIKLADRLHNVRTLAPLGEAKQHRIATETLEVYAPLAHRLGVQEIKHEMEERCFAALYPKRKEELEDLIAQRAPERESYIEKVMIDLEDMLAQKGIEAEISGRPKHVYSIYRKMMSSGLGFEDIHDLIGIRVLVHDVTECYAVLGLVHTKWPPIHGRFKDYIAMPKYNLYQSLHTTVVGPDGKALEVQIRTREMHETAEYGIAAHWRYKEGASDTNEVPLVADLRFLHEDSADPSEFLSNLKLDLYADEVFALTPKGTVITLPAGATPVDFAYRIHTDVGHSCIGAKVDGRLVPLHSELESGDIVEIVTSKNRDARPSRDWLDFVVSSRASSKIRRWFALERRETALHEGRDQIYKMMRRQGISHKRPGNEDALESAAHDLGFADIPAMFVAVGDGRISPLTAVRRLERQIADEHPQDTDDDLLQPPRRDGRAPQPVRGGIIIEGMQDLLVRIARCCAPVPGDDIVGFITVGRGVSVHRADCTNVGALAERSERMIEVSWAPEQAGSYFVWIQVEALDRARLMRDITAVLSDNAANVTASSSATGSDRIAVFRFEVELSDSALLERLLADLRTVNGVFDAYRLVPQTN